jgi:hypothetical protein
MIRFIAPYTFTQFGTAGSYSAVSILHTFQFTVAHALGFSAITSRIQATDLSQSHWNFKPHVKSSLHSHFLQLPIPKTRPNSLPTMVLYSYSFWTPNSKSLISLAESESYVTTDGQPASLSWNKAPIWGLRPDIYYCPTVAGLLIWGALSDERTGLSFTIATGLRQRSHFRFRVP